MISPRTGRPKLIKEMVAESIGRWGDTMETNVLSSIFSRTKNKEDASPASTSNATKIVSISVVLFAVIAQALAAIGAISLSPALQVTIWLVAGGFIVLLSIADMACRAYAEANRCRSAELPMASVYLSNVAVPPSADLSNDSVTPSAGQEPPGPGPREPLRAVPDDGSDTRGPVPAPDGNAGDDASARQSGPRLPVKMEDVFPQGCYLVPASISETYDYDEKNKPRPAVDELTRQRVFECRVVDMDPERKGWSRQTEVKIVADQMPVPPTQAQYGAVEFEGLTAIPYATDSGQEAYDSLRATGIRQAITRPAPGTETAA